MLKCYKGSSLLLIFYGTEEIAVLKFTLGFITPVTPVKVYPNFLPSESGMTL